MIAILVSLPLFCLIAVSNGQIATSTTPAVDYDIPGSASGLQCQRPPVDILRLYPSGTVISVSCPDDYDLVGADQSSCGFSGLWSTNGIGFCRFRKVACPAPEVPPNSFVAEQLATDGEYLVGNYIQYSCNRGYELIGNSIIRCNKSPVDNKSPIGVWSTVVPRCERNDSPPPTVVTTCNAPPFVPEDAVIIATELDNGNGTFGIGGSITYNCTFCFSLSGARKIDCERGGVWSPNETPICIQTKFGYYLVNNTLVRCIDKIGHNSKFINGDITAYINSYPYPIRRN